MSTQERAVMQQALDALDWNKCYLPNGHPSTLSNGAIAALRQALAEPARTFVEPVTEYEVDAAFEQLDLLRESTTVAEMRRALEGFAAGRAAGGEPVCHYEALPGGFCTKCGRVHAAPHFVAQPAVVEPLMVKGLNVDRIDPTMAFDYLTHNTDFDGDLLMQSWEALKKRAATKGSSHE